MKLRSNRVITATDVVVDQIGKIIGCSFPGNLTDMITTNQLA